GHTWRWHNPQPIQQPLVGIVRDPDRRTAVGHEVVGMRAVKIAWCNHLHGSGVEAKRRIKDISNDATIKAAVEVRPVIGPDKAGVQLAEVVADLLRHDRANSAGRAVVLTSCTLSWLEEGQPAETGIPGLQHIPIKGVVGKTGLLPPPVRIACHDATA